MELTYEFENWLLKQQLRDDSTGVLARNFKRATCSPHWQKATVWESLEKWDANRDSKQAYKNALMEFELQRELDE